VLRRVPPDEACGGATPACRNGLRRAGTGSSPWGSTSEPPLWQEADGSAPGHFQVSTSFTAFEITKILRLLLSSSRGTIKKPSLSRVYPWVVPIKVSPSRKVIFTFIWVPGSAFSSETSFVRGWSCFPSRDFTKKTAFKSEKRTSVTFLPSFPKGTTWNPFFCGPKS